MSDKQRANELSNLVIGAAIEVHKELGPGLLESTYEVCLCKELSDLGVSFQRQAPLPVRYKNVLVEAGYRIDVLAEDLLIVEIKAVEKMERIHEAQLLTYLRLSNLWLGLLLNFNVCRLNDGGIKRLANGS